MTLPRTIVDTEAAILRKLRAGFPENVVPTVEASKGRPDKDWIERHARRLPALVLNSSGGKATPSEARGETYVYVLVRDDQFETRTNKAKILIERVVRLVLAGGGFTRPKEVDWADVTRSEDYERGVALWAVRWDQAMGFPPIVNVEDLDEFRQLWVELFGPGEIPDPPVIESGDALAEDLIELEQ